jgi:hypothetical protein
MKALRQMGSGFIIGAISLLLVIGGISLSLAETSAPSLPPTPSPIPTTFAVEFASPLPSPTQFVEIPPKRPTPTSTTTLAQPTSCVIPAGWVSITVSSNDTLYSIAERYKTTADILDRNNCLNNIPPAAGAGPVRAARPHGHGHPLRSACLVGQGAHREGGRKPVPHLPALPDLCGAVAESQLHGFVHHHSRRSGALGAERADQHAGHNTHPLPHGRAQPFLHTHQHPTITPDFSTSTNTATNTSVPTSTTAPTQTTLAVPTPTPTQ